MIEEMIDLTDAELKKRILIYISELQRRKVERERGASALNRIIDLYFQGDIRKLQFISELNFLKYKNSDNNVLERAKKELWKLKLKFHE